MILTKDEIFTKSARPQKCFTVDAWGGDVIIRGLTIQSGMEIRQQLRDLVKDIPRDEKGDLDSASIDKNKSREIDFNMLSKSLVDENGNEMFSTDELRTLGRDQEAVLVVLIAECYEFNGFIAKAVEGEAKNSEASPNAS